MSYLTARAEQALIGAMLADQPLPAEFGYLRPDDFGHRALRQIYTAILDLRDATPTAQLPDAVAARVDTPGVDADWLRELRDACPSTAHIAAYARMVQVASFRRTVAAHGERIAASAVAGRPTAQTRAEMTGMADALTRQAEVYQAFTAIDETQALRVWRTHEDTATTVGANERAAREDQLLADLLAHPEQARAVAQIVPPETFTSQQRRDVFMTMVTLAAEGEPIDEIILLWEFERLRAAADLYGAGDGPTYHGEDTSHEPTAAYVARLAATTVVVGSAITIGHELVVEDVRNQLARSAAAALGRQTIDVDITAPVQPNHATQLDPNHTPPPPIQPGHQPRIER